MGNELNFEPAIRCQDLVSTSVAALLNNWPQKNEINEILVAEIDSNFAGGNDFCSRYGIAFDEGANCVIAEAVRGDKRTFAACLASVGLSLSLNKVVRKTLNARRVSLAPLQEVLERTNMEYGSITAFGLPEDWLILVDSRIASSQRIVIGSGLLKSKLLLPQKLPNMHFVEGLAYETN